MSIHGSAMMYVTRRTLPLKQAGNHKRRAFDQSRLDHDLRKPRPVRPAETVGVGVIAVAEDGQARIRRHDLVDVDPGDVGDDQIGRDAALGGQRVLAKEPFQPPAEEEIDSLELDRRHGRTVAACRRRGRGGR